MWFSAWLGHRLVVDERNRDRRVSSLIQLCKFSIFFLFTANCSVSQLAWFEGLSRYGVAFIREPGGQERVGERQRERELLRASPQAPWQKSTLASCGAYFFSVPLAVTLHTHTDTLKRCRFGIYLISSLVLVRQKQLHIPQSWLLLSRCSLAL